MLTSHQSDSSLLILCTFSLLTCFSAWLITKLREGNVFTPIRLSVILFMGGGCMAGGHVWWGEHEWQGGMGDRGCVCGRACVRGRARVGGRACVAGEGGPAW